MEDRNEQTEKNRIEWKHWEGMEQIQGSEE